MRKAAIIGFGVLSLWALATGAQDTKGSLGLITETGNRIVIVDGNELYSWCSVAERTVMPNGADGVRFSGSREDEHASASCWAYVEGVADSTPTGGEFNPGPDVRVSQYIDVVTEYLKNHANIREQAAAVLVQNALRDAFPTKR